MCDILYFFNLGKTKKNTNTTRFAQKNNIDFRYIYCHFSFSVWSITLRLTSTFGQSVGMPGPWWFFHHLRSSCSLMDIRVLWSSLYTAFTLTQGHNKYITPITDTLLTLGPLMAAHLSLLVTSRCLWMERKACFRKLILFLSSSCDWSKMASISSM